MSRYKGEIARSLDNLQSLAENLISSETNRRIQLGREKEARVVDAYKYMLSNEENQIKELELSLDAIENNLMTKGIELTSVGKEYRTEASKELLSAANEGAMEMINVALNNSKDYKNRLLEKKRKASKIARHIDLFDDAISITDPAATGEKSVIEASDVADAAAKFMTEFDDIGVNEIGQRLEILQSEGSLRRLNEDYYARLAKETEDKITAAKSGAVESNIILQQLQGAKKETQEAVGAQLSDPLLSLGASYRPLSILANEISEGTNMETGEKLSASDVADRKESLAKERNKLGSILFPWAGKEGSSEQTKGLQAAVNVALGITPSGKRIEPNYDGIVNYIKIANAQYQLMPPDAASRFREELLALFNFDIAESDAIERILTLNEASKKIDIEEGEIYLNRIMPALDDEAPDDEFEELMKRFELGDF